MALLLCKRGHERAILTAPPDNLMSLAMSCGGGLVQAETKIGPTSAKSLHWYWQ